MNTASGNQESGSKLIGRYVNKVDEKGRTFLPAAMRPYIHSLWGAKPDLVLAVMGFDRCLVLVDRKAWFTHQAKLNQLDWMDEDAAQLRRLASLAEDCRLDQQGRIALPQFLREFAQLSDEVMFVGCVDYIELWNPKNAQTNLEELFGSARAVISRVRARQEEAARLAAGNVAAGGVAAGGVAAGGVAAGGQKEEGR
jgi:MraZ protein